MGGASSTPCSSSRATTGHASRRHRPMTNATRWLPQLAEGDVVGGPFGSVPLAVVDPADVGAVAARALSGPGHAGETYRLSGP